MYFEYIIISTTKHPNPIYIVNIARILEINVDDIIHLVFMKQKERI